MLVMFSSDADFVAFFKSFRPRLPTDYQKS